MGANDFKLNKVPLFHSKTSEYLCFEVCCPETNSCLANCYNCDIKFSYFNVCAKFFRIKRGSDGAHDFKLYKVPLFARKPVNINVWSLLPRK